MQWALGIPSDSPLGLSGGEGFSPCTPQNFSFSLNMAISGSKALIQNESSPPKMVSLVLIVSEVRLGEQNKTRQSPSLYPPAPLQGEAPGSTGRAETKRGETEPGPSTGLCVGGSL